MVNQVGLFMTDTTIYGIANCDKVRSARAWLEGHAVAHRFHDFRLDGLTRELLDRWCDEQEWMALLNRQSTSWRKLAPDALALADHREGAMALMLQQPTLIR